MSIYKGTFQSNMYFPFFVNGTIELNIETMKAIIIYKGLYLSNKTINSNVYQENDKYVVVFNNNQKIILTVELKNEKMIKGTYQSLYPSDTGIFSLSV